MLQKKHVLQLVTVFLMYKYIGVFIVLLHKKPTFLSIGGGDPFFHHGVLFLKHNCLKNSDDL